MNKRFGFLVVGLVSALGLVSNVRAYDHVLTGGLAVFQDDFEDGVYTDKWTTYTNASSANFEESGGTLYAGITSRETYKDAHFYTLNQYNFFDRKTEFTMNYQTWLAWDATRIYFLNAQHPWGKGFGIFYTRFTDNGGGWKSQVRLYEMRNGPSVELYDSGLVGGIGTASFSLVLDKDKFEFYWNYDIGGATTLRASGTHSLTAAEIGDGLYMSTGVNNGTRTDPAEARAQSFDAGVYQMPTVHGVVDPVGYAGNKDAIFLKFQFQPLPSGDNFTRVVNLAADGSFQMDDFPAGDYHLVVKGDCWLEAGLDVSVDSLDKDLGTIQLKGADANGDNRVSFEDFSLLQNNYGDSGAAANPLAAATATGGCGALGLLLLSGMGLTFLFLGWRKNA